MRISIIITSYNYGSYVERCVRSCLLQNFDPKKYEVVVVDDASTDNTLEIIEKYKKYPSFRIIKNEKNVGVAEASNIGIRSSLGQFVVRVDADDYIDSRLVLFLYSYLESNNGLLGVACDYYKIDDGENVLGRFYANEENISCGIMYRKDMLAEAGLYNPDFRHCEEKELRARLGDRYRIDHLKMPLYRYRIHNNNKTKQTDKLDEFNQKIKDKYDN